MVWSPVSKAWPFSAGEPASVFSGIAGVVARVLIVLSRVAVMGKEEDGDGVLMSSHLLGQFLLERCLVLLLVVRRLI